MGLFRKKVLKPLIYPSAPIIEVQTAEMNEEVEGRTLTRMVHVPVDITSKEYSSKIPTYKEYYLQNLIDAGVPLNLVNVQGVLNPSDQVTINDARIAALKEINAKID